MKRIVRTAYLTAICLVGTAPLSSPAMAVPGASQLASIHADAGATIKAEPIQFRRHGNRHSNRMGNRRNYGNTQSSPYRYGRQRHHRSRRNYGRDVGISIGAAILGSAFLSHTARATHRRNHASAWDRCAATYRSFEWNTGMYTGYDGNRHKCQYLN